MNREDLDRFINDFYGASAEFLWASQPSFAVYRHSRNKKWFAVIMELKKDKIGLSGEGSVLLEEGIHKGYHMNKNYWITVRLDGSVETDKIKWLLDLSFELTNK